jgi:exonuclease III
LIKPIPDGGNRIVGIRLNTTPPILILCVYLPCRGNSNTDLFQETLDELSEILEKYKNKANILLGGDMNVSLRRDSAQDRQFKCFLNENDMKVPPKCTHSATFLHFNGKDTSQIHYVLESTSMINEYVNFEREALNT